MIRRLREVPALFAGWPEHFEWYALCAPRTGEPGPDHRPDSRPGGPKAEASADALPASSLPADTLAVAGLDWATIPGGVGLHLEVLPGKWGKTAFRICREALPRLEAEARRRGARCIVGSSTNAHDARRWFKFTELFGFTDQTTMILAFRRLDGTDGALPGSKEHGHARG